MSGFDANPFADPRDTNPFADPAVISQTRSQPSLGDYNPFASQPAKPSDTQGRGGVTHSYPKSNDPPATINVSPEPPPPYTATASQNSRVNVAELQKRQEELERKADELQAREDALKNANYNPRVHNWPPLPSFCCVKPCMFQDISLEIPQDFQRLVRTVYYLWLFYVCILCLNVIGTTALLIQFQMAVTFGFSILALVLFVPLSFLCWFRPLYKAFRNDSSFYFMVFFFMFFFQAIVCGIYAIGIVNVGSCGYIVGFQAISNKESGSKVVGGIVIFIAVLWSVASLLSVLMLIKVHRIYRLTGASMTKAQAEFTSTILSNEHVQSAATNVAVGAAQAAVPAATNAAAGAARNAVRQTLSGGDQQNHPF